jgi:membrane-associated phospholipid phosphatase
LRACTPHDWLVFCYLVALNVIILPRLGEPGYAANALRMGALLAFFVAVVVPVRAGLWRDGLLAPLAYRVALQGTVQASYFFFVGYLPFVNPRNLDSALYALDLRLFGFEPSLVFDRYVNPISTEWFAFFYFCYFLVLTLHTVPIVLCVQRQRMLCEFTLGMLILFCTGHIFYMIVPGFGPIRALNALYATPFPRGLWLDTVMETVRTGGAQKDIFPSLHTAAPTFITLFSFRHRASLPFRYSWPLVAFFAFNIVIATLFLRWHWLIDVVAGLCLAMLGWWLSVRITDRELTRRRQLELSPPFPHFHFD